MNWMNVVMAGAWPNARQMWTNESSFRNCCIEPVNDKWRSWAGEERRVFQWLSFRKQKMSSMLPLQIINTENSYWIKIVHKQCGFQIIPVAAALHMQSTMSFVPNLLVVLFQRLLRLHVRLVVVFPRIILVSQPSTGHMSIFNYSDIHVQKFLLLSPLWL